MNSPSDVHVETKLNSSHACPTAPDLAVFSTSIVSIRRSWSIRVESVGGVPLVWWEGSGLLDWSCDALIGGPLEGDSGVVALPRC